MQEVAPRLVMEAIVKEFPGVKALSDVNFRLFPGEVHALMGENGAGKSTLIKVLTGVYDKDEGNIQLEDDYIDVTNPLHAQDLGISTVYQEVNLCPNLSVAENIFIGRQVMKKGRIDWREMNDRALAILSRLNLSIDVSILLSSYSVAIQQMVAIARALNQSAKILILDEPTSSLDSDEVDHLFKVIKKLKEEGLAIVFVSHFLDQVYRISDRITVLRNGRMIGEYMTKDLPKIDLVSKMIGKEWEEFNEGNEKAITSKDNGKLFLEAENISNKGYVEPFKLKIYKGEIIGIAGLLGSGRTELVRLLFGADKTDGGTVKVNGHMVQLHSPKHAISKGIAFCSEDRKAEGIIPDLTVRENIILALQGVKGWFNFIPMKKQLEIVEKYIKLLNINPANPEHLIKNLSGGNQQKVMLARWLIINPELLILDEPTRGIDIGAKSEIMKLILSLSDQGKSVLFVSSEIDEILRICKKIIVLRDRKKVSEIINGSKLTQHKIIKEMAGRIG